MMQIRTAAPPEYYLTPDYQTEGAKLEAQPFGHGSRLLGVEEFGPLSFLRLAKGLNPESGSKLTARLKESRRSAWDVSFTVPKSVSILIEVMERQDVKDAMLDACGHAMKALEKQAEVRVRKGGVYQDRKTGNIAGFSFYHGTTRPAKDDGLPDPHAHVHAYLLNLTYDRKEKQWKALQIGNIDRPGIERAFHKRLAKNLRSLGYRHETKGNSFEVKGVGQEIIGQYSRRYYEVERFASEKGYTSPKAKAKLGQFTRSPKVGNLTMQDVRKYWIIKLGKAQLDSLLSIGRRARAALRMDKWRDGLQQHVAKLRSYGMEREERSVERGR